MSAAAEKEILPYAIAIIDGTGEYSDIEYARSMDQGFCKQMSEGLSPAQYERGPSGEGYRIRERSVRAADFLTAQAGTRLMLAGYSRGGSAAVIAAQILESRGLNVDWLFLFDPVARHFSGDTSTIPGNVANAWIARRRIGAPEMDKYDYSILGNAAGHNPVRNWFGTTATTEIIGVDVTSETFLGSHGAMGGVGWTHVKEDSQCQRNVASFMKRGFDAAKLGNFNFAWNAPNSKPPERHLPDLPVFPRLKLGKK